MINSQIGGEGDKSREHSSVFDEQLPLLIPNDKIVNEENHGFRGASFSGSVFNLSTTTVGAGIMALPAAMKVLGLGPGIVMIIFMAFLTKASIEMLVRFSRVGNSVSYGSVMGDAFGRTGRIVLQIIVIIKTLGILIVYMIIIGDALSGKTSSGIHHTGVLEEWFGSHWWNERAFVLALTTFFIFAPLASLKKIDSLSYTSALSIALAVLFVVITVYVAIVKLVNGSLSMPRWMPQITDISSFLKLFSAVPVLVTAFICHYNVHSINNELRKPSQMLNVVCTSLTLCTSIYITTSFFGFLLFGEATLDDVLVNFDENLGVPYSSILSDVVRISYAVHLMLVFPIIFYALRLNVDGLLFPSARPLALDCRRFSFITAVLIVLLFVAANYIPSIWDVFQFTGSTAAVCVGFIFPASIVIRDPHGIATKSDKIVSFVMMTLSVFSSTIAIYSDISSLFK